MPETPKLPEIIDGALDARLAGVFTSSFARVVAYDSSARTVDVQPLVRHRAYDPVTGEATHEDLPIVAGVKVLLLGRAGFRISIPIEPGDVGLLLFAQDDVGAWQAGSGEIASPQDSRRHGIGGGAFIPGITTDGESTPQTSVNAIVIEGPTKLGSYLASHKATREDVLSNFLTLFRAWVSAHTHPVSGALAGTSTTPGIPPVPSDLGAASVEID